MKRLSYGGPKRAASARSQDYTDRPSVHSWQVSPAVRAAHDIALTHIGGCEHPPGSNRRPEIDAWRTEFGSSLGSFWCAIAGLITTTPECGAAVVYTNDKQLTAGRYAGQSDAEHIGLVLRVEPVLVSIEGNTTLSRLDSYGYVQTLKEVEHRAVTSPRLHEIKARIRIGDLCVNSASVIARPSRYPRAR